MIKQRKHIIEVLPYCNEWPQLFSKEAKRIQAILKDNFSDIHHIGSTSVPNMPAKPTIDILLAVNDIAKVDLCNDEMAKFGYEAWGEYGIGGRRFFIKGNDKRSHHVHAFKAGSKDIMRHLHLRDYLIAHPNKAQAYADLKIKLAKQFTDKRRAYVMGKQGHVKELEEQALAWADESKLLRDK